MIMLKDVIKYFNTDVEIFNKGQYVGNYHELDYTNWVFKKLVLSIDYIENAIRIDTF